MTRKRILKAYVLVIALFLCLCGAWYGLNMPRRHYYNDSIEGRREASPYWAVVKTQDVLSYPIGALAVIVPMMGIYELGRWMASKVPRNNH